MTNLSSLPPELLDRIIDLINSERHEAYNSRDGNGYFSANEPLLSLSLLSRNIHAIVAKHLYRTAILETWNLPLFLRTVLASVQLRALVRQISFEFESEGYSKDKVDGHPERNPAPSKLIQATDLQARANEHVQRALGMLGIEPEVREQFAVDDTLSFTLPERDFDKLSYRNDELPHVQEEATMLLFLLSNLNSLRIDLPEESDVLAGDSSDEGPEFEGFFRLKFLRGTFELTDSSYAQADPPALSHLPAAFRHLEEIHIHDPYMMPGTIKTSWPPVLFWKLPYVKNTFYLPQLKRIKFDRCSCEDSEVSQLELRPSPSSIEEVEFSSAVLHVKAISELVKGFKILRRFKFRTPDYFSLSDFEYKGVPVFDYLSPAKIVNALLPQRANLEEFKVDSIQRHPFEDIRDSLESWVRDDLHPEDDNYDERVLLELHNLLGTVDLVPFTRLHTAAFHITDFVGVKPDSTGRLSDRLPASLQTLRLAYDPMVSEGQKDSFTESFSLLSDLMADVASGKLPALKRVELDLKKDWYEDSNLTHIKSDAEHVGVSLRWIWHTIDSAYEEKSGAKPARERGSSRLQRPGTGEAMVGLISELLEGMDEDYEPSDSRDESSDSADASVASEDDGPPGGVRSEDMVAPPPPPFE